MSEEHKFKDIELKKEELESIAGGYEGEHYYPDPWKMDAMPSMPSMPSMPPMPSFDDYGSMQLPKGDRSEYQHTEWESK
jgi:hypothetical protein